MARSEMEDASWLYVGGDWCSTRRWSVVFLEKMQRPKVVAMRSQSIMMRQMKGVQQNLIGDELWSSATGPSSDNRLPFVGRGFDSTFSSFYFSCKTNL
ncbi:hypothetical protein RYX36_016831 [Vicia faba]